ncbi:hypothetical protein MKX01_041855 [Papaver californicum]|nr:hypothetical protein MKX01_041855 [Papaver californicum]
MHECIHNLFPISEQRLSSLEDALCKANSADQAIVSAIIDEFSEEPTLKEKSAYHRSEKGGYKVLVNVSSKNTECAAAMYCVKKSARISLRFVDSI